MSAQKKPLTLPTVPGLPTVADFLAAAEKGKRLAAEKKAKSKR